MKLILLSLCVWLLAPVEIVSAAPNYLWPLGQSATTPDVMNTSYGPRVNFDAWDFHDGIDLPAPLGTPIYAARSGSVHLAGPGGTGGYSSRHVILQVNDPADGMMYLVHLHMNTIDPTVTTGAPIAQGQLLGTVGMDDASYPHLHFEFRKGTHFQIGSVHPLGYMPYTNTANFTAPVADRFNRFGPLMAARLLFGAASKLEGDLKRVEVDLKNGATLLSTRVVDFNDKTIVNEGNADGWLWANDIGVEGYQTSNMVLDGRTNLQYGILLRNLPSLCNTLVARVIDVGSNVVTSVPIPVPSQTPVDQNLGFEDGAMPPAGWTQIVTSGLSLQNLNDAASAHSGTHAMLGTDNDSTTNASTQRAGIEFALPTNRFEYVAEAWIKITALNLGLDDFFYPLVFFSGGKVGVAARIRNESGALVAGIIARNPDFSCGSQDCFASSSSSFTGPWLNTWHKWKIYLERLGTRETTGVLYLDGVELTRLNWDSTAYEPTKVRAGVALTDADGATATVLTDELRLTESTPAPINQIDISKAGNLVTLTWSEGQGPYQVQKKSSLTNAAWLDVGGPIYSTNALDTNTASAGFYRVLGQ